MGVEILRNVICDRCGSECSNIYKRETFITLGLTELSYTDNVYHYTEVQLKDYDSRYESRCEQSFILCGDCVDKFGEFLKRGRR